MTRRIGESQFEYNGSRYTVRVPGQRARTYHAYQHIQFPVPKVNIATYTRVYVMIKGERTGTPDCWFVGPHADGYSVGIAVRMGSPHGTDVSIRWENLYIFSVIVDVVS